MYLSVTPVLLQMIVSSMGLNVFNPKIYKVRKDINFFVWKLTQAKPFWMGIIRLTTHGCAG
jgi:hypothetical protein